MNLHILVFVLIYSQIINIFETLLWVGKLWGIKPPFKVQEEETVKNDAYHLFLSIAYIAPFLLIARGLEIVGATILTWLLNDVMWHFWSVHIRYWLDWIKFYFNPKDNSVLWYARLGFTTIRVTPRRMFGITLFRVLFLGLLEFLHLYQ